MMGSRAMISATEYVFSLLSSARSTAKSRAVCFRTGKSARVSTVTQCSSPFASDILPPRVLAANILAIFGVVQVISEKLRGEVGANSFARAAVHVRMNSHLQKA